MIIRQPSPTQLFAGIVGIAISACGGSGTSVEGTGGATSVAPTTGGTSTAETTDSKPLETGGAIGSGGRSGLVETGGAAATGGKEATGGKQATGGKLATGGKQATGGAEGTGGKQATGGVAATGGSKSSDGGVAATGGKSAAGGVASTGGKSSNGGTVSTGGSKAVSTGTSAGTCIASSGSKSVSGSGPHKVVMETNSGAGIKSGTIYRPAELDGTEKYPIFVWGNGACSQNGTSNQAALGEIASHGYFVIADGTPGSTAANGSGDGAPLLAYITWAIAENDKPCSAYYQNLDTTKIASDGFSCGGLMSENASGDPRLTAVGITSSGLFSADQNLYKKVHTPFKILLGGSGDMAYENGERDYTNLAALGIPILLLSKNGAGHGGDLSNGKGDFNTINLAWLNWQLKGDETATGKALLIGSSCKYCKASSSGWEFKSANIE